MIHFPYKTMVVLGIGSTKEIRKMIKKTFFFFGM